MRTRYRLLQAGSTSKMRTFVLTLVLTLVLAGCFGTSQPSAPSGPAGTIQPGSGPDVTPPRQDLADPGPTPGLPNPTVPQPGPRGPQVGGSDGSFGTISGTIPGGGNTGGLGSAFGGSFSGGDGGSDGGSPGPVSLPEPAPGNSSECIQQMDLEAAKQQRIYRRVLFGFPEAAEAEIGDIRYDDEGTPWIKVSLEGAENWETFDAGGSTTRSDDEMDDTVEEDTYTASGGVVFRRGIFETRRVLTSDLVPYLSQSIRSFQCRTEQICELVTKSKDILEDDSVDVDVAVPGCIPLTLPSLNQCHLVHKRVRAEDFTAVVSHCKEMTKDLIQRESELLEMVTGYDAAYRSLLQVSGITDDVLKQYDASIFGTLRQVSDFVPVLSRVPCFAGSCDSSPPPEDN